MRVRVRFRYNAATGQVEVFQVDDVEDAPRTADHDLRHNAATRSVASVVDPYARVEELVGQPAPERSVDVAQVPADEETSVQRETARDG